MDLNIILNYLQCLYVYKKKIYYNNVKACSFFNILIFIIKYAGFEPIYYVINLNVISFFNIFSEFNFVLL